MAFFVSLLVSKKLRAGSAHPQHVMSQDRMIFWDPGFGRVQWPACACPQSPVFVCGATLASICTRVGGARLSADAQVTLISSSALLSFLLDGTADNNAIVLTAGLAIET